MAHGTDSRWGAREYRFATESLRAGRFMRVFVLVAGAGCVGLAVLLAIMQFHPAGPSGAVARTAQLLASVSALAVGVRWLVGPWPSHRQAITFVVWADIAASLGAVTMSTPAAQLTGTTYLGLIGIFAGFVLGSRILVLHCLFAGSVIVGVTVFAVVHEERDAFWLFIYYVPALTWVVAVPLIGSVLIDLGRRAIVKTARSAHYDPLTGLRNRRGMHASVGRELARRLPMDVTLAVFDIDNFKQINDDGGHVTGDAALVALAARLREVARPDEYAARIGGDELVLISFGAGDDPAMALRDRVSTLTCMRFGDADIAVSVGIATMSTTTPHFSLVDVLRHADAAMYEAKRSGGATCAVYATKSTTVAAAGLGHRRDRPA